MKKLCTLQNRFLSLSNFASHRPMLLSIFLNFFSELHKMLQKVPVVVKIVVYEGQNPGCSLRGGKTVFCSLQYVVV